MGLIYAIILIGVLVFVHELGHFIVAKIFGVRVHQFAIGYGPSIFSFRYGETEYCIKALPLGGYVMMQGGALDEVEQLPEEERSRSLMAKPIWQRVLVTLAGPAANIIFPIIIYFFMLLSTTTAQPAVVGAVFADMPAAETGLEPGDVITKIGDQSITYWPDMQSVISSHPGVEMPITYVRNGKTITSNITPKESFQTDSLGLSKRSFGLIGVTYASYGPTVAVPSAESVAGRAGLKTFDQIAAVDGEKITRYDALPAKIADAVAKGKSSIKLLVLRPIPLDVGWGSAYRNDVVEVTLPLNSSIRSKDYGIDSAQMYLSNIETNSPAEKAGLKPYDKILSVNGKPYRNFLRVGSSITNEVNAQIVKASKGGEDPEKLAVPFEIVVLREGKEVPLTLTPAIRQIDKQEAYRVVLGFRGIGVYDQPPEVDFPLLDRVPAAFFGAFSDTWNVIKLTMSGIWGMLSGRFGLDNLGGPIMIGNLAAQAGDAGIKPFLNMMSLISINLALMNLLPIPVLDGGQLLLYFVEAVQRRPLSFRTRQMISYIGVVIIILMVILAFKNDIERSWDDIVIWFNE